MSLPYDSRKMYVFWGFFLFFKCNDFYPFITDKNKHLFLNCKAIIILPVINSISEPVVCKVLRFIS
jgi:hypothetical protein